ncbi:hypothetical protein PU629_06270 [Pullulanibacillus sp. KACC 23026]|nr:hypothetical protein [Pullulanibacillus sp. KACC 23026]WEG13969.1 hypothetical protein PU629_06270 [Pullulanibacillus sp. KACC 23026]
MNSNEIGRKNEHDQLELLKKYLIEKGEFLIDHCGKTIFVQHIQLNS